MTKILRVLIPLAILAGAIAVVMFLVRTKPQAQKKERKDPGALVEVTSIEPRRQTVVVEANGTVMPARQVMIGPEISGRVRWINDKLIPGGKLEAGDTLIRVDASDYSLAVEQQRAAVDRARTELELEKSRKKIAEREWELLGEGTPEEGSLALRDPQLRTAEVAVKSAESGLDRAKLAVSKTVLKVPFNAIVQQKQVELGQIVAPQTPIVNLVGTDAYWVQVSVPVSRLGWLSIPGVAGAEVGSPARVWQKVEGKRIERQGRIIRMLGDLDPVGRMARLLVEIEDPLGLDLPAGGAEADPRLSPLPLLLGSYVNVELEGHELDGLIELPRSALRDGDQIFLLTPDNTLAIGDVEVIWRRSDSVLVKGIEAGARVITSPLAAPVEGMKLRTPDMIAREAAEPAGDAPATPAATGDAPAAAKAGEGATEVAKP
jgi:multidrug efflux pump subunit AcrA (membrane-fusion protein)